MVAFSDRAVSHELTLLAEELDALFEKDGKVETRLFWLLEGVGLGVRSAEYGCRPTVK